MTKAIVIKTSLYTSPYKLKKLKRTDKEKKLEKVNPMLVPNAIRLKK